MGDARRGAGAARAGEDVVEELALVTRARRELLLRVHSYRLRREDLEDCYSQATLELVAYAQRGGVFCDRGHMANALEQRFLSRIQDRRRALSGRSPMQAALEGAVSLDGPAGAEIHIVDSTDVEQQVILRQELQMLQALALELTFEQRLVLACQISLQMECGEFCRIHGWTAEKYRKVAQRGRARLRRLMALDDGVVPAAERMSDQTAGTSCEPTPPTHRTTPPGRRQSGERTTAR